MSWADLQSFKVLGDAKQVMGRIISRQEDVEEPMKVALTDVTNVAYGNLIVKASGVGLPERVAVVESSQLLAVDIVMGHPKRIVDA
jgi:hypothetical protein